MSATNNSDSGNQSSEHQTLPFFFTPVDEPRPGETNPHAQATTYVPDVVEALQARFGEDIGEIDEYAGEQTIYVDRSILKDVAAFVRSDLGFTYFVHCGAIDRFTEDDRFEMFYNVVNIESKKRLRIKVRIPEDDPIVSSVTEVWRAADWHEREAWDMMGIRFEGHPDLRRMHMPEDFEYHPQRKEFPLLGVPGSLPLPPQVPEGPLTLDPFAAAHGHKPPKSYLEPSSGLSDN
jgi:NADH-quinone oxidoreductase subunit C